MRPLSIWLDGFAVNETPWRTRQLSRKLHLARS